MSKSRTTTIADAVVAQLNAASLSQGFTAVRKYRPIFQLGEGDLDTLQVVVVPVSLTVPEFVGRIAILEYHMIDVGLFKKLSATDGVIAEASIDPYTYLMDEIRDMLMGSRPSTYSDAICMSLEKEILCDRDTLETQQSFAGIMSFNYQYIESL